MADAAFLELLAGYDDAIDAAKRSLVIAKARIETHRQDSVFPMW